MEAWHFLRPDGWLNYPPHMKVEVGQTLTVDQEPILCERGLHASVRPIDALKYAPGAIVCRVRLGGTIVTGDDKVAATERMVLWMAEADRVLVGWAAWCAAGALIGAATGAAAWAAMNVELKRRLLALGGA